MSILVVGSMALDTIETPFGGVSGVLGGSACYFSLAASIYTDVRLVAVVGDDFDSSHLDLLASRSINLTGLRTTEGSTFKWHGRYGFDLGDPETLKTELNVFEHFKPVIPADFQDSEYVFLANIDPELQLYVLNQVRSPRLIVCDTMNYWIENKLPELKEVLGKVNVLVINDSETRELGQDPSLVKAAYSVLGMGPEVLVVKRGEYGVLMFSTEGIFWAPSYPLEEVVDPTGAGDSFAGGFLGYLAREGNLARSTYKLAVVNGSVVASYTVEDFSVEKLKAIGKNDIDTRFLTFINLSTMD